MAIIGQRLASPEPGWQRYNDNNSSFIYIDGFNKANDPSYSGGSRTVATSENLSITNPIITFYFVSDKLRVIMDRHISRTNNILLILDDVEYRINCYNRTWISQALVFEKLDLDPDKLHKVQIMFDEKSVRFNSKMYIFNFDAIDIAEEGTMIDGCNVIKQDGKYYSFNEEQYDISTGMYNQVTVNQIKDVVNNPTILSSASNLYKLVTIGEETFRPIDKFNDEFKIISTINIPLTLNGLKGNELLVANGDFSTKISTHIDEFSLYNNPSTGDNIRVVVSNNSGVTWKTYTEDGWKDTLLDIPLKPYNELNSIELTKWKTATNDIINFGIKATELKNIDFNPINTGTFRFAYVLIKENVDTICEGYKLTWKFDSIGSLKAMSNKEVSIELIGTEVRITPTIDCSILKTSLILDGGDSHSHSNKSILDKINELDGKPTYDGKPFAEGITQDTMDNTDIQNVIEQIFNS